MVATVDGRAAVGGKAAHIGSDIDRRAMRNLRANSDAVMVGANTLRAERLSLGLDEDHESPQPLAIILTTAGDVPLETNLVFHERQTVLVVAGPAMPEDMADRLRARRAEVLRGRASTSGLLDLEWTLRALKQDHAVESLLVEGGPTLNRALISAGLADELFLTVAPKLLGATPPDDQTLLSGTLVAQQDLVLLSVHLAADELFLRYAMLGATAR